MKRDEQKRETKTRNLFYLDHLLYGLAGNVRNSRGFRARSIFRTVPSVYIFPVGLHAQIEHRYYIADESETL